MGKHKKITNGVKVSFYIPNELHEQMKEIAQKYNIAISDAYRLAVRNFIEMMKSEDEED
jgi:antitoxin component of RelBE/YafQ-DinJ toxin-antitoxin module